MNREKRLEARLRSMRFDIARLAQRWMETAPTTDRFSAEHLPPHYAFGWTVILTCDPCDHGHRWHLSMKLYPVGRGSTMADWTVLGMVVEACATATGHPRTTPILPVVPFEEEDPNAAHHFSWHPDGSPVCEVGAAAVQIARAIMAEREKGAPN